MEKQSNKNILPLIELFWYFIMNCPSVISLLIPVNRNQKQIILSYLEKLISKSTNIIKTIDFFIENDLVVGLKKMECVFNYNHVKLACDNKSIRVMSYFVKYRDFELLDNVHINKIYDDEYILQGSLVSLIVAFIDKNMGGNLIDLLESYYSKKSMITIDIILSVFEESLINKKNVDITHLFVKQYVEKYEIIIDKNDFHLIFHNNAFSNVYSFLESHYWEL